MTSSLTTRVITSGSEGCSKRKRDEGGVYTDSQSHLPAWAAHPSAQAPAQSHQAPSAMPEEAPATHLAQSSKYRPTAFKIDVMTLMTSNGTPLNSMHVITPPACRNDLAHEVSHEHLRLAVSI